MNTRKVVKTRVEGLMLFLALFVPSALQAQINSLRTTLDDMFSQVNLEDVPTGYLRDYAVEEENLDGFTGKTLSEKNVCSQRQFEGLVRTLQSAAVSASAKKDAKLSTDRLFEQKKENGVCNMKVLLYKYAQIKSNVLNDGLFLFANNKLQRTSQKGNPYMESYLFATSCDKEIVKGRTITVALPRDMFATNCQIQRLEFDLGIGYSPLLFGERINVNLHDGTNVLKLRVTLSDGTVLKAQTAIRSQKEAIGARTLSELEPIPVNKVRVDKTAEITGQDYGGVQTSANVNVHFANGHSFQRPVVFVEGFDPHVSSDYPNGFITIDRLASFISEFDSKKIDLVYVDWNNSEEYLQANANTLIEVLKWLNNEKKLSKCTASTIVLGHSMGGIISRYALKKMENENVKHDVGTYISYDAPHLGANVPIGVLYAYYGIKKFLKEKGILGRLADKYTNLREYISLGDAMAFSTAAQQMLIYSVDATGTLNNQEHLMWQKELNSLGFPRGDAGKTMKLLAVAGGSYQKPQNVQKYLEADFSACTDLLSPFFDLIVSVTLNDIVAGLLSAVPGKSSISGIFDIYSAQSAGQLVTQIEMKYKKKFLWTIPVSKTEFAYKAYAPNGYMPDIYPSSFFPVSGLPDSPGIDYGPIFKYNTGIKTCSTIPFIPSSSALAFGNGINTSGENFLRAPKGEESPFGENYFVEQEPQSHLLPSEKSMQWIMSAMTNLMIGSSVGSNGSKYSVVGLNSNTGFPEVKKVSSWSTSNGQIATIDGNGILSVHGKGIVSVIAKIGDEVYSKKIMVGMPRFILAASQEPNGYKVVANCIDDEYKNHLSDLEGILKYRFGRKKQGENIEWTESDKPNAFFSLGENDSKTTFLFMAVDAQKNKSPLQTVDVNADEVYYATNNNLYIDASGNLYKSNKSKYSYKSGRVYIEYMDNLPEKYKERKWMNTAAMVISPYRETEKVESQDGGPLIRDIVSQQELEYISQESEEGQIHKYLLALTNYRGEYIQFIPFTITFKKNINE